MKNQNYTTKIDGLSAQMLDNEIYHCRHDGARRALARQGVERGLESNRYNYAALAVEPNRKPVRMSESDENAVALNNLRAGGLNLPADASIFEA